MLQHVIRVHMIFLFICDVPYNFFYTEWNVVRLRHCFLKVSLIGDLNEKG